MEHTFWSRASIWLLPSTQGELPPRRTSENGGTLSPQVTSYTEAAQLGIIDSTTYDFNKRNSVVGLMVRIQLFQS